MVYCKDCGKKIEEDAVFCSKCGKSLNKKDSGKYQYKENKELKKYKRSFLDIIFRGIGIFIGVIIIFMGLGYFGLYQGTTGIPTGFVFLLIGITLILPIHKWTKPSNSIGIKILVFLVGMLIASLLSPIQPANLGPSNNIKSITPSLKNEVKEIIYSLNQEIKVDYLTYKVTKAESFTEMGTSFLKKETEGKFIKVYLTILNNAKETKQIFTPRFKLIDNKDRKYERVSDDIFYISNPLELGKQLQPGLSTSGSIIFEIPKDSDKLILSIKGDWLSISEVKVAITEVTNIGKDTTLKQKTDAQMDAAMVDARQQMDDLIAQQD